MNKQNDIGPIDIMLDARDLDMLQDEYETLALAELTDDIDCSISNMQSRANRLEEIEELVGTEIAADWSSRAECRATENGYASGKPYK